MALDNNALSSLSATLDELTARLGDVTRAADENDDARLELFEVERQLQTSSRRLAKIVARLTR